MTRPERARYELFVRVRQFGVEHSGHFSPSSTGGKLFAAVGAAAARIEAHLTTKLLTQGEGPKQRAADRAALLSQMRAVARTARAVGRHVPGADRAFRMPRAKSDVALLTAARAFVTAGEAAKHRLISLGLPDTFITDLQQLIDRLDAGRNGREASRNGLRTAQGEILKAIAHGFDAVRQLDAVVPNALKNDPVQLAVWERLRRLMPTSAATTVVTGTPSADVVTAVAPTTPAATDAAPATPLTNDAPVVISAEDAFKKAS